MDIDELLEIVDEYKFSREKREKCIYRLKDLQKVPKKVLQPLKDQKVEVNYFHGFKGTTFMSKLLVKRDPEERYSVKEIFSCFKMSEKPLDFHLTLEDATRDCYIKF
ncbi:MAG: hypothetical protein N2B06_17230 [Clostridium sp.]